MKKKCIIIIAVVCVAVIAVAGTVFGVRAYNDYTLQQQTEERIKSIDDTYADFLDETDRTEKDVSNAEKGEKTVALNNEYITRYQEVNQVTYPSFVFNYPDNWSVTKEECNQQEELVTLENDGDASVTFLHYSGELQGGSSGVYMNKEEISKVASSQFVPGFVQATDHSSLGEFMVARIKTIGKLNMQTDREYTEVDGNVAYAVLPVSEEGIREGVRRAISGEYTFWYSSTISFTASTSEELTPQEEKEVIAILNSFRIA